MATRTLKELFADYIKVGKFQKVKKTDLVSSENEYMMETLYDNLHCGTCIMPLSEYKNAGQVLKVLTEDALNQVEQSNEQLYISLSEDDPLYSVIPSELKEEDYYGGALVKLDDAIPYIEKADNLFLIVENSEIIVAYVDVVNMTAKEKAAEQKRIEDRKQKLKEQLEQTQSELRLLEKLGANGS